jgi:ATP-dependent RNA helicase RhlE
VPEDYVHRIGRTGRAGKEGQAVSLVCLDEEGFMQEIERFTKQQIPVQTVEGFGPEPGEQAEPIAMGRQVLWGGKGRPPSREVLNAAAKAARSEMMQRIRENKDKSGQPSGRNGSGRNGNAQRADGQQPRNGNGNGQGKPQQPQQQARPPKQNGARNGHNGNGGQRPPRDEERQPREGAHNSRSPFVVREPVQRSTDGQPDPLRTSVDSMARNGRRGGGRPNRGGGGGGFGARGPGNPSRTFGR